MLDGLRTLDCSDRLGWLAGRILADLGAEVVKVEPPDAGLGASDWQAYNANKRLLRLDPGRLRERAALVELLAHADILIETAAPGSPLAELFRPDELRARNPRLIQVSIRPFGADGPRAHWQASDLELMAAGGALSLAGEPGGAPTRVSAPQAGLWAGAQAAVGALVALAHRGATGAGQQVAVSAQAAVLTALAHAPTFYDLLGQVHALRQYITGRTWTGARMRGSGRAATATSTSCSTAASPAAAAISNSRAGCGKPACRSAGWPKLIGPLSTRSR
jgi:benzylsuccinate CoA-transferase BbsE subunit